MKSSFSTNKVATPIHPAQAYVNETIGEEAAKSLYHGAKPTECNCRSTNCIQLYCECFFQCRYCGSECTCKDCFNVPSRRDEVCFWFLISCFFFVFFVFFLVFGFWFLVFGFWFLVFVFFYYFLFVLIFHFVFFFSFCLFFIVVLLLLLFIFSTTISSKKKIIKKKI